MLRLHGQQFVLGPEGRPAAADWVQSRVPGWGILSRSPDLRAHVVLDRDGVEWSLLGRPLSNPPPAEQLTRASTAAIPDLYRFWAGRWTLIGNGQIHMDAAGLLGCFFHDGWVSSSAAMLKKDQPPVRRSLRHGVGMDWYPPPLSRFAGVRRLLPSQVLHSDGHISARPLLKAGKPRAYGSVLDDLQDHLLAAIRAAAQTGAVWIPLTGGYDSRLVLAAAHKAGIEARTYTQKYADITNGDWTLPPKLARAAGVEHTFIWPQKPDPERYRLYDEHTGGHCVEHDREFVACSQWDWAGKEDIILRGGCFELGRCFYFRQLGESFRVEEILRGFHDRHPVIRDAMTEWVAWCVEHPEQMDWRDRFYWEQRLGGWLSAVEQSIDLSPAGRTHVANSHRFYELVMELPTEVRRTSQHQIDLVGRMAPALAEIPFNPRVPLTSRITRKAMRQLRALCARPWTMVG